MLNKSKQNGKNEIIQLKTPVKFALEGIDKIDKYLKELDKQHKGLTIQPGNKQDYESVRLAIKDRRELRGKISTQHKEGKKDIIEYGRLWDKEKKRIIDKIMPRETELKAEKKKEDDRIQAIKNAEAEAEEKRKNDIRQKIADIQKLGVNAVTLSIDYIDNRIITLNAIDPDPEEYAEFTPEALEMKSQTAEILESARANRIKLDQEEADRKAETERLEKEREELAKQKEIQDKKDAELKAEQEKIDNAKAELENQKEESKSAGIEKQDNDPEPHNKPVPISDGNISQPVPKSEPENKALRLDKQKIRILAEDLKSFDVPEILDPNLLDMMETELLIISACANRLLEGIE